MVDGTTFMVDEQRSSVLEDQRIKEVDVSAGIGQIADDLDLQTDASELKAQIGPVKFSFAKRKLTAARPPLFPTLKLDKPEDVEYVTEFDEKARKVSQAAATRIIPKLENSWLPEKRMRNIVVESDQSVVTEETSLDAYENMPVEEFGEALLRGLGWEKGKPIGRNSKTTVSPIEHPKRLGREGLGAIPAPKPEKVNGLKVSGIARGYRDGRRSPTYSPYRSDRDYSPQYSPCRGERRGNETRLSSEADLNLSGGSGAACFLEVLVHAPALYCK